MHLTLKTGLNLAVFLNNKPELGSLDVKKQVRKFCLRSISFLYMCVCVCVCSDIRYSGHFIFIHVTIL
jgi:hypothetical protein